MISDLRFVVDDSAFATNALEPVDIEALLIRLSNQLQECRARQESVGIVSHYPQIEVNLDGTTLNNLLVSDDLDRDARLRAYSLLDKCLRLDADQDDYWDPEIEVNSLPKESYGLSFACRLLAAGHAIAAIVLVPYESSVVTLRLKGDDITESIVVVTDMGSRLAFYRTIFSVENVQEGDFFSLARLAFPDLCFADGLSFRRFDGAYADLRATVVEHLSALNDVFPAAFVDCKGMPDAIAARVGINVSPEGNTRSSERLMALRDVEFDGSILRCEWHSKIEPHRNRIHFHPGDERTHHILLVGIFVNHLET
jgi:hypothetical protein